MVRRRVAIAFDCLFPYTTGGGERLYGGYAERMSRLGSDVDYLTAEQWDGPPPTHPDYRIVPVTGRLKLYDARGVRRTPAALAFAAGLLRTLVSRRNAYDAVVVSGLPVLNVFAARLALWGSRTTLVVDYLEVWGRRQWVEYAGVLTGGIAWILQGLALRLTPIAACHSRLTARQLRDEGFTGTLRVSPGLIENTSDAEITETAADPPYVLYVGRHIPDKRVESLPAAVAVARQSIPDLRLVILGDGPSSADVRVAVEAVDGASWTDRPGFVDQAELDALMGGAACLANPSRREGYGLVVVEAAAHGTPVVLVDDAGNAATELVDAGENGFVAASAEPDVLAAALLKTIAAGSALRRSARRWYDDALRTKTLDRTVEQLVRTIDDERGVKAAPPESDEGIS